MGGSILVGQLVEWWDDSGSGWISVDGTPFFFFFEGAPLVDAASGQNA